MFRGDAGDNQDQHRTSHEGDDDREQVDQKGRRALAPARQIHRQQHAFGRLDIAPRRRIDGAQHGGDALR